MELIQAIYDLSNPYQFIRKVYHDQEFRNTLLQLLYLNLFLLGYNIIHDYISKQTSPNNWIGTNSFLWLTLWQLPVYLLSLFLNATWFDQLATQIYRNFRISSASFSTHSLAGHLTRYLVLAIVLLLLALLRNFPILYLLGNAWISSYYAFEYKWNLSGLDPLGYLSYLERHWLYFIIFGTPLALLILFIESILPTTSFSISSTLFSLGFPFLLLSAAYARPSQTFIKLPIFRFPIYLAGRLLKHLFPI